MARFNKIQTLQAIIQTGMVPVYYNKEVEIAKQVVKACYEGGVRAFEFTNRGDFAHEVFGELVKYAAKECPELVLGVGSIVDLTRLPSALFVVDVMKEHIAVREANRLGIPVFGMVDTNSNPNNIDYVIPANDDATKSVEVILGAICEAMNEGLQERKAEKIDAEAAEEAPKRERKAKAAVKKERTKKEDDDALNANVAGKFAKDEE